MREAGERRGWAAAVVLYLVAFAIVTSPLWLQQVHPKWDALNLLYPAFAALSDALRSGRFPLWDPYTNCGYPLYADAAVSSATNPIGLASALLAPRPSIGFAVHWLTHWAWAGLGAMLLARRCGASPAGGVVAASAYALSGFFVGHGEHTPFIVTAAWLPWTFALADHAVEVRRIGPALLAGVALGASALGGYPGLTTFGAVALALWLALRWLTPLGDRPARGAEQHTRIAWVVLVLGVCAVLLAAIWSPALVAFFREGQEYTDRIGALPPQVANYDNPFPPLALTSLIFPVVTVLVPARFGSDVSMINGYAGLFAVPLAAVWVMRAPRKRWWIVAFTAFMLLLSLGGAFGVRRIVYVLLPVTRYMRHNGAFRLFWILALAVGAGCGASLLERETDARRMFGRVLVGWALLAVVVAAWLWLGVLAPLHVRLPLVAWALVPPTVAAVLIAALARMRVWTPAIAAAVAAVFIIDGAVHVHRNSITLWDKSPWVDIVEAAPKQPVAIAPRRTPPVLQGYPTYINAQQIVRVPVAEGYVTMIAAGFNYVLLPSRFREVLLAHRFWMVPGRTAALGEDEELKVLAATGAQQPVPAYVTDATGPTANPVMPGSYGAVRVEGWAPERIDLRAISPGGGLLVTTERFARGWSASVDGRPARVERVNLYFLGVALPPGEHAVELTYGAGPFFWFAALSAVAALGATAMAVALEARARRVAGRMVCPRHSAQEEEELHREPY